MRIATNSTSFSVWTSYTKNLSSLQSSMSKLSTGSISNTDDPAGIGIADRMQTQIDSSEQAYKNTQNAVSLLQTADSWLSQINDDLSRMKELSVEAKSVTSDTDQSNIETEYSSLQSEITRITSRYTSAAKFNGIYLFRGGNGVAINSADSVESGSINVQIGADVNQTISLDLADLQISNHDVIGSVHTYSYDDSTAYASNDYLVASHHVPVTWSSIIDAKMMSVTSTNSIGALDIAVNFVATARASMAAQQSRLEKTGDALLTYQDNLESAKSKISDIDMASETTRYSTYNVLTQSADAMLAQANQLPQTLVLSLLQG